MAETPQPDAAPPEDSLARIEAGGIPLAAEQRLAGIRDTGGSFTSDLSMSDYALCRQVGLRPLAQVMGSSIYQVGYPQSLGWIGPGRVVLPAMVTEIDTLTDAWNEARERALGRLAREALLVGADAVVGVSVSAEASDWSDSMTSGVIEYSVIGTAVARNRGPGLRDGHPVLTELSVADYAKLLGAGIEPAGIVAWSSVCYSTYSYTTAMRAQPIGFMQGVESFELTEFTEAIYAARERVMVRLGTQAHALGAGGIVGVRMPHTISRQALGQPNVSGLLVTLHAIGTAIDDASRAQPAVPKPTIDLLA